MTSATDGQVWFRFIVFDQVTALRGLLDLEQPQVVETRKGERVIATEAFDRSDGRIGVIGNPNLRASWGTHDWGHYANGHFAIAAPVMGVDWTIIQTYGWDDFITATWRETSVTLVAAMAFLMVLWAILLLLDRQVFAPAIERASPVYESDALNRAIIATSPVGLCLLDTRTRAPIIQSKVMATYASESVRAGGSLYERLLVACEQEGDGFQMTVDTVTGERTLHAVVSRLTFFRQPVWLVALRDVTAQALTERALRDASDATEEARDAAEAANQAKSAFVAMISHEIRTPLNGLMGHLELLSRTTLDEWQRDHVERLSQSASTLLSLVGDVLDFSRIESGLMTLDPVWFNLRELIEQVALLFVPEASGKGVHIHVAVDPALKESYRADMGRIRQVLHNLMSHAVKFTDSGRVTLRVCAPDTGTFTLRFVVVDSGIGMNAEQLSRVFEPFMQADQSISRRFGGSGLGLALCRQIAELLDGQLSAQSTPNVGSLFRLDIPAMPASVTSACDRPLAGRRVILLSASNEWRHEMALLLDRWGADTAVGAHPSDVEPSWLQGPVILLLAGGIKAWSQQDEDLLAARSTLVVDARLDGPATAVVENGRTTVSCYVSAAILQALQQGVAEPASEPSRLAGKPPRYQRSSLVVEDHPVNRELLSQQLDELGYNVVVAENGLAAIEQWREGAYAAVITDINMPGMNGYELTRWLRERDPDIPILATTASSLASERRESERVGVTQLLLKPLSLAHLSRVLSAHAVLRPATPQAVPERVRQSFVFAGREDVRVLREAVRDNDTDALSDRLHAMKGVLPLVGHPDVAKDIAGLENLLAATTAVSMHQEIEALAIRVEDIIDAMESPGGG